MSKTDIKLIDSDYNLFLVLSLYNCDQNVLCNQYVLYPHLIPITSFSSESSWPGNTVYALPQDHMFISAHVSITSDPCVAARIFDTQFSTNAAYSPWLLPDTSPLVLILYKQALPSSRLWIFIDQALWLLILSATYQVHSVLKMPQSGRKLC